MSNIRSIDMMFLDDAFEMGGGYVLNFSDRSFAQFFAEELNIDIDNPVYAHNGTSKAKRLRCFLQSVDKATVVRTLNALWEYREAAIPCNQCHGFSCLLLVTMWGPKSAEARERAAELRVQLRSGVDPVEKRKSERAAMRAESAKLRASEAVAHECHKQVLRHFIAAHITISLSPIRLPIV